MRNTGQKRSKFKTIRSKKFEECISFKTFLKLWIGQHEPSIKQAYEFPSGMVILGAGNLIRKATQKAMKRRHGYPSPGW